MRDGKVKLLYIASNGRSGSTILEMLLNVSPHLWTLGEFHVLPWEVRQNVKPCGCGHPVDRCEFWGPIIAEHRETLLDGTIDRFRKAYNVDRVLRYGELSHLVLDDLRRMRGKMVAVERYARDNEQVFHAAMRQTGKCGRPDVQWLIDSSKSPYRLLWLAASGRFDLRVIHLMKDPRAFAYSVAKHCSGVVQAYRVARAVARWQVENRLFDAVSRRYLRPQHLLRLRYEQLASDPEGAVRTLAEWLNVPAWTDAPGAFRGVNHGISGNPSRFESSGIRLDEKWKQGLPRSLQRLAYGCGWHLVSQYGYKYH